MITASCHCGAVRYTVQNAPEVVLDCNCSHCRLYGGLWAYYPQRDVKFEAPADTFIYMWGDRTREFHPVSYTHLDVYKRQPEYRVH